MFQIASKFLILCSSDFDTKVSWDNLSLLFFDLLPKRCLLYACFLLIFPEPVTLNRFLAPECVFIFGIVEIFRSAKVGKNFR